MNDDLIKYYKDRAQEYERIYSKPERQEDIKAAAGVLKDLFRDKEVFEIACGTGFWTECIAQTALSVCATDINPAVLEIAKQKKISNSRVDFQTQDLYVETTEKKYQSLFGGFILSHIPKQELENFFKKIKSRVQDNGTVVLMDNLYVAGSNHPITETDGYGNTYQLRKLDDGSIHKVLKNFVSQEFLKGKLEGKVSSFNFISLKYFWILSYTPLLK